MARRTLLDFFDDLSTIDGTFVVHDDGYRTWSYTYAEIVAASRAFAGRLRDAGIKREQKVVLWCENRPEWIVVLWGCLLEGIILVPIDYRSSSDLMLRIADIVDAKCIVVGEVVPLFVTERPCLEDRRGCGACDGCGACGKGDGGRRSPAVPGPAARSRIPR